MQDIIRKFSELGGSFVTEPEDLRKKINGIKAFIFDWDGVFNNGQKIVGSGSPFSEVDSMGTNLLRFSHYLKTGQLPLSAIISGEKNDSAISFSERECFHYSFFKTPHKIEALEFICKKEGLHPSEVAYVFDDVLDLSIAKVCGLRVLIRHKSNVLFEDYCRKHHLADYITASDGNTYAVRETCELLMGLNENFDDSISNRAEYTKIYSDYLVLRKAIKPQLFSVKDGLIQALSPF
jgi:3-deoxy-D-manno-octulosonate 8-phosphate phosphatase (KDO 8-P phosphatase)